MDVAARAIKPGVTTDEIDELVHNATIAAGMLLSLLTEEWVWVFFNNKKV